MGKRLDKLVDDYLEGSKVYSESIKSEIDDLDLEVPESTGGDG